METARNSKTAIKVTHGPMTQMHRDILEKVRKTLVNDMDPENILLKMAATKVFTDGNKEEIKAKGSNRRQQCEQLLDILQMRGDIAYDIFKNALGEDHAHLAYEIVKAENEELSLELTRERTNSAELQKRASGSERQPKDKMGTEKKSKTAIKVTDEPMTQMHRDILEKVRNTLVNDMDPKNILLKMAATKVFTDENEEEIKAKGSNRRQQCEQLLDILQMRGDIAYDIFKNALGEDHAHLANEIVKAENEELSLELTRKRTNSAELQKRASENEELSLELTRERTNSAELQKRASENDGKSVALPSKVLESLLSQSCDSKEVVLELKDCLQLDQASLEQPDPGTKRLIRCLARKAKQSNRLDVFKHLREITPAGTTGPLLPECSDIRQIPFDQRRKLTVTLSGGDDWKVLAAELGLEQHEISYFDKRSQNPCDALLEHIANYDISVGFLYNKLIKCKFPVVADLL